MNSKTKLFTVLALSMLIFACTTKLYVPTAEIVAPNSDLSALNAGRTLMMDKCSKCHGVPKPEKHTPDQWVKIMDKMAPKAKLKDNEKALVLKYATKGVK